MRQSAFSLKGILGRLNGKKGGKAPLQKVNPLLIYGLILSLVAFFYTSVVSPKAAEIAYLEEELMTLSGGNIDLVRQKRANLLREEKALRDELTSQIPYVSQYGNPVDYAREVLYVEARKASLNRFFYEGTDLLSSDSPLLLTYAFNFAAQGGFSSIMAFVRAVEESGLRLESLSLEPYTDGERKVLNLRAKFVLLLGKDMGGEGGRP